MTDDTSLPFTFPAVGRKKVTAAFDGGRITSGGGVMLLAEAEHRLGVAAKLAAVIPDGRDASRVTHPLADILRARIFAIACGRLPDSGRNLRSQPMMSRWENAPDLRSMIRLGRVLLDLWLASYLAMGVQIVDAPSSKRAARGSTPARRRRSRAVARNRNPTVPRAPRRRSWSRRPATKTTSASIVALV